MRRLFDFDRDGLLDLYITGTSRSDMTSGNLKSTRIMKSRWTSHPNGGRI